MTDHGLWVQSEVQLDGTYAVSVSYSEDGAFTLNRDNAVRYAVACIALATEADHNVAVMRLLTGPLDLPADYASDFIGQDLMPDRPDHDEATMPLKFITGVGRARRPRADGEEFLPLLVLRLGDEDIGQLSPADLRGHGTAVLTVLAAADLDASLHRCLISAVGLDDGKARALIGSLADFMPEPGKPREL